MVARTLFFIKMAILILIYTKVAQLANGGNPGRRKVLTSKGVIIVLENTGAFSRARTAALAARSSRRSSSSWQSRGSLQSI
jgi:hypothetical protein